MNWTKKAANRAESNSMNWLASAALTSAITAMLLAIVVWAVSRMVRWPALTHLLWVIVLLKLLTPPLVEVPLGLNLDLNWPMEDESSEALPAEAPSAAGADGQVPRAATPPIAHFPTRENAPPVSASGAATSSNTQMAGVMKPAT